MRWLCSIVACATMLNPVAGLAEEAEIWSGWTNIVPCTKLVTDNGFPYIKTASQELHTDLYLNSDKLADVGSVALQCTKDAAVSTLLATIVPGGAAAIPSAKSALVTCMSQKGIPVVASAFRFAQYTKCNW